MPEITEKQKKFVDEYLITGEKGKSYAKFYKAKGNGAEVNACRTLKLKAVSDYLKLRNAKMDKSKVAGIEDVRAFWTDILNDKDAKTYDRIKVSELIAKTNGMFIDRVEHSGKIEMPTIIIGK